MWHAYLCDIRPEYRRSYAVDRLLVGTAKVAAENVLASQTSHQYLPWRADNDMSLFVVSLIDCTRSRSSFNAGDGLSSKAKKKYIQ